jgi:ABC-type multidrug transport system fused ATPase/permease subunit
MWFGAYQVKNGNLDMDDMLKVFYLVTYSSIGLFLLGTYISEITNSVESAQKIFKIIDYQPEINAKLDTGCTDTIFGSFEFVNVSFAYINRSTGVLKNINFTIPAGSSLGITGTTGSGKSTIAQLLIRFYDPTEGHILLDNKPLKDYNLHYLRDSVCWVGQEPILFQGSILFNIQIGRDDIKLSDAVDAMKKAQALDILEKYGLESDVGLRGSKLSGGQKQRVAIARALARRPKVLVLDESTSALDSITETAFQGSILKEKLTLICVAHRLRTIKEFDKILVCEKGRIVEMGKHLELVGISGRIYQKLFENSTN